MFRIFEEPNPKTKNDEGRIFRIVLIFYGVSKSYGFVIVDICIIWNRAPEAGGTAGRNRGNPAGRRAAPAFKMLYKNPLGKPS